MHAHMPPYTQPEGAYDSRRLREETIAIAVAQDAKLDAKPADPVHEPSHYKRGTIECINYIRESLGSSGFESYCIGNVIKYVSRYRDKGGAQDLEKAKVYLGWAISAAECERSLKHTPAYVGNIVHTSHPMHAESLRVADERPGDLL